MTTSLLQKLFEYTRTYNPSITNQYKNCSYAASSETET